MTYPRNSIRVHKNCVPLVEAALQKGMVETTEVGKFLQLRRNKDLRGIVEVIPDRPGRNAKRFYVINKGVGLDEIVTLSRHKLYKRNNIKLF